MSVQAAGSSEASGSARASGALTPAGAWAADWVHALSTLLYASVPAERERTAHLWGLAALVIAGAWVRFAGLGSVGLHGDEETMAMAVRHILIDGRPLLPSGMFYPRGLTQLYLMAMSVSTFGESEWALRLPSALCGVAVIWLVWLVGRRFLRPRWNLALAASAAFLPDLIIDSQTARMYIFLVAAIAASMACLFAWERTGRLGWLAGATLALIVGIDLHALAVAAILMFMLPGIVQGDVRKLIQGACAATLVGLAFLAIDAWVAAQYPVPPPEFAADLGPPPWERLRGPQELSLMFDIAVWVTGIVIAFLGWHALRTMHSRIPALLATVLLLAGIGLQLAFQYHLAGLAYLAGVVIAWRYSSSRSRLRLATFAIAVGALALLHATLLASTSGSLIKLIGAMVGQPSVWPYVRIAQLSPAAAILTGALLAWGLYRIARHRLASDYWLLAVLGVWAPVFALGMFAWNVPPRYTEMSLVPMLVCAFACAQHAADWILAKARRAGKRGAEAIAAVLISLCVINPAAARQVIEAGYGLYPDHKGAAEFMRTQHIVDDDIVLAEDVLQQTYYLGSVDYWLIGPQVARRFVKRGPGGGVVDFYTGTPVIATGAMLDELLHNNSGRRIFVIGSGEQQSDQRRTARGEELNAALLSDRFETLYIGRDGLTRVWRAVPGAAAASPSNSEQAQRDQSALESAAGAAQKPARKATPASARGEAPPHGRG